MRELADFVNGIQPWHWWTLGAILIAIEIASTTFYLLWPGIAALLVGGLKYLDPSLDGKLAIFLFAVFAVVATVIWKRSPWGQIDHKQHPTLNAGRAEQYRGRVVLAAEDFSGSHGAVLVDDTRWRAVTVDGSVPNARASLVVVDADGTTLKVRLAV